jgi:hypothetical protein
MRFKPWLRNISPLAWMFGASLVANVITMCAVLYIAFGSPRVRVYGGFVDTYILNEVGISDRSPIRVKVVQ